MTPTQQTIVAEAQRLGIDPATALAYAERESSFNPQAKASKTIRGLYQMRGDIRGKYEVPDDADEATQVRGWGRFFNDLKGGMSRRLGRDATDSETYLGHHFGEGRAARMINMDPETPVDSVFTPEEMRLNPHFGRAGTVGNLNRTTMADIDSRRAKFGGSAGPDLSEFGDAVGSAPTRAASTPPVQPYATSQQGTMPDDFSSFGTLA